MKTFNAVVLLLGLISLPSFAFTHNGHNIDNQSFICQVKESYCELNGASCKQYWSGVHPTGLCTFYNNKGDTSVRYYGAGDSKMGFSIREMKYANGEIPSKLHLVDNSDSSFREDIELSIDFSQLDQNNYTNTAVKSIN
ncbi:MAG: hypothetical protein ACPGUD_11250 [Parashewanella sp.]